MSNTYVSATYLWTVDSTGNLETEGCTVTRVIYFPSAVNDDFQLTDTSDNLAIPLKASASDTSPVHIDLTGEHGGGRRLPSLKVGTIDGGTAYVFLRKEEY